MKINVLRNLVISVILGVTPLMTSAAEIDNCVETYTHNMYMGVMKGLSLRKKAFSKPARIKAREIIHKCGERLMALAKRDGIYEEYVREFADPRIHQLDEQGMECENLEELLVVTEKQMQLIKAEYPKLYQWISTNKEVEEVLANMMKELSELPVIDREIK